MYNYKLHLMYDGTRYLGWQRQSEHPEKTIQGKVEHVLSLLFEEEIQIIGSGRTDANVHALMQVANFQSSRYFAPSEIRTYLAKYLPQDIAITYLDIASERFHARYNALSKRYCYTIDTGLFADPFKRNFTYHLGQSLDLDAMNKAARCLEGTHDFKSFTSLKSKKKSTIRKIFSIDIIPDGDRICIYYHGNGFLQHMVRILTGTLIEVGLGNLSPDAMPALIEAKTRSQAGPTVPAQGLCLQEVLY
ncbi:MAG: tRNA pseudouridine(38-40) synthase TruA [Cellulosilyticaceae bacterium]